MIGKLNVNKFAYLPSKPKCSINNCNKEIYHH